MSRHCHPRTMRTPLQPILAVQLAFAAVPLQACTDSAPDHDLPATTDDSGSDSSDAATGEPMDAHSFSDDEVRTILIWLSPLPETPHADLSNAYADDAAAALFGQRLFYDPRYSANGEIACVTCHNPAEAFGDSRANLSTGIAITGRSSPALLNGAFGAAAEDGPIWQFWDGRSDSQWAQALAVPEGAAAMASTRSKVALHLYDEYRDEYEAIFGAMAELRDADDVPLVDPAYKPGMPEWDAVPQASRDAVEGVYANFGKSVAAYERLLVSRNSRFDRFWHDLDEGNLDSALLSEEEREGLRVFIGAGRCLGCHSGPNFTDGEFHNIAIPQSGENVPESDQGRAAGVMKLVADKFNCAGTYSDHPDKDSCPVNFVEPEGAEVSAFKTPSLRSVGLSAPYMHTGNFASLEEVVRHYDVGGAPYGTFEGTKDELLRPLALDARQRTALVAFLRALDGEALDPELLEAP
jgi:cytochrome c peroxidase